MRRAKLVEGLELHLNDDGFWLDFKIGSLSASSLISGDVKTNSLIENCKWNWCIDYMNKYGEECLPGGRTLEEWKDFNSTRYKWLVENSKFLQNLSPKFYADIKKIIDEDVEKYGFPSKRETSV